MLSKVYQRKFTLLGSVLIAILALMAASVFLMKHLWPDQMVFQNRAAPFYPQKVIILRYLGILGFALTAVALLTWAIVRGSFMASLQQVIHNIKVLRLGQVDRLKLTDSSVEIDEINREFIQLYDALVRTRCDLDVVNHSVKGMISFHTEKFRRDIRFLKQQINIDSLTGLSNRGHLDTQLPVFYDHAQKNDLDLACLMIDVDHFKTVNDSLGHATGDELIYFVGELLQASVRDCDLVARYGGDEFAILMLDQSGVEAMIVAERIRRLFSQESQRFTPALPPRKEVLSHVFSRKPVAIEPKLSIGLATLKKSGPLNAGHLLQLADASLYRAKRAGRNCVKAG